MVVRAVWPGATAEDTAREVTDRLEKALQSLQWIDYIASYTKPGESHIDGEPEGSNAPRSRARSVVSGAQEDRGHQADPAAGHSRALLQRRIRRCLCVIYAFTTDGFTYRELRDTVESARSELLRVPNVGKVDLIGVQKRSRLH